MNARVQSQMAAKPTPAPSMAPVRAGLFQREFAGPAGVDSEVRIEELVLHGLPLTRSQGPVVQAAVETELARLLTEQGMSRSSADTTPRLSAGSIQLTKDNNPAHLGDQIGQAVYGSLIPTPASLRQTRLIEGASG